MSSPIQTNATPVGEFVAHFGAPPDTQDAAVECAQWERLCAELLAERAQLQAELTRARAENKADTRALVALLFKDQKLELTMEEVYAQVDKETTLEQVIAEIELEAGNKS